MNRKPTKKCFSITLKGEGGSTFPYIILTEIIALSSQPAKITSGKGRGGGSQRIPQRFISIWEVCFNWLQHALKL